MENKKIIGSRIKERRIQLGLSQTRLAELVGYSDKTAISKIEHGLVDLPQSKLNEFAKALDTNQLYLTGHVGDPEFGGYQTGRQTINEVMLLSYFRILPVEQQKEVIKITSNMVEMYHAGIQG